MTKYALLSAQEERYVLRLAANQPKSARQLQALFERIQKRTIEVVLADPGVTERLKGARFRVLAADLHDEKSANETRLAPRLAEVGIYNYDRNVLVVPVVDLRRGSVVRVEQRQAIQPPATPEELEEATEIVLSAPRYQALKKRALQVVANPARATFSRSHPWYGHRCFTLYFWTKGRQPKKAAEAVVDLSTRSLLPQEALDQEIIQEEGRRGG